jgi:hypothetical protein
VRAHKLDEESLRFATIAGRCSSCQLAGILVSRLIQRRASGSPSPSGVSIDDFVRNFALERGAV